MTSRRKQLAVLSLATFVLVALFLVRGTRDFLRVTFDKAAWHDEAQVQEGVRLEMADDLLVRDLLIGKTRAEIIELLGEPTPTGKFADWDLVYWLGPERGFIRIDSEWLVLRFGAGGRVVDNRIVRD